MRKAHKDSFKTLSAYICDRPFKELKRDINIHAIALTDWYRVSVLCIHFIYPRSACTQSLALIS